MSTRRDGALRHSGPSTVVRPVAYCQRGRSPQSRPLCRPSNLREYLRHPPENPYHDRRHRFLSVAGSARSTDPACAWPHRGTHGQFVALLVPSRLPLLAAGPPVEVAAAVAACAPSRRRSVGDMGTLRPITAALTHRSGHRRCGSLRHRGLPSLLSTGHLRTLWPERRYRCKLPSRTPSD